MLHLSTRLKEKITQNVNQDNIFVWKKAFLLCQLNIVTFVLLLIIAIPAHSMVVEKNVILVVGDVVGILGMIISVLLIRRDKVFSAGMVTVITLMLIPILHNVIGDWLFQNNVTNMRFFETLISICFLLPLVVAYSINRWQIVLGTFVSVLVVLGHFLVLRLVIGIDISYNYLIYVVLVIIIGKIALTNLNLSNEAIEYLVKSKEKVTEWNKALEDTVEERTKELMESNKKLEALSSTDGLTGIGNRRYFDNALQNEWSRAQRTTSNVALIIGDVDWFKNYNDIYGHVAGDECLRLVAKVFKDNATRESDLVARYGGEEFVALLPVITAEQGICFAEMLIKGFRELNLPHSGSKFGYVTISLGIAVLTPNADQKVEDLLKAADAALYLAKTKGRNQYVLWNNETSAAVN